MTRFVAGYMTGLWFAALAYHNPLSWVFFGAAVLYSVLAYREQRA